MFTLIVENEKGEQLELTHSSAYDVIKIDGLNPPSATINVNDIAGLNGSIYNSSRINSRNIVIYLNIKFPVEENRQLLYDYFRVGQKIKLRFKNKNRNVFIDGYVETFENDLFGMTQQPQISVICPDPFFKESVSTTVDFSKVISLFEFPFAIDENIEFSQIKSSVVETVKAGDVEMGMIITLTAMSDQILNPKIYNRTAQKFFGLGISMNQYDVITINTNIGKKSVTLMRSGKNTNIISKLAPNSAWLILTPGANEISYDADKGSENLALNLNFYRNYGGI